MAGDVDDSGEGVILSLPMSSSGPSKIPSINSSRLKNS